jgi:GAF domain-containing protein
MGPSESEVRLRTELDRVRRELAQLKKEPVGAAAPEAIESADPRLEQRIAELERTKERLSKLYFAQLDENRKRSARLHAILRVVTEINADRDLETLVQRVADTIQESLGFRLVLIRLREPGQSRLAPVAFAGLEGSARVALEAEPVSLEDLLSWTRDEFRVSRSFFIGHKHPFSRQLPAGYVPDLGRREEWEWHPEDVLLVPLTDARGEPMGYFSVDDPEDRLVPSQETVELLEVFAGHAVVAIENARLYRQLAQRTGELEEADRRMREVDEI